MTDYQTFDEAEAADRASRKNNGAHPPKSLLVSSADFVAAFVAPDYLIEGICQRAYLYSLTAPTGSGKTSIALRIAAHVALGQPIGEHEAEQGRVLFLAGENPDDIRGRWLGLAEHMGFDADQIEVYFVPGKFDLLDLAQRIEKEIRDLGGIALVVVDTSAVYFTGDFENDNVQVGNHARTLRKLVELPGKPCVVVNCHPTKNASPDNLLPRGGGAFLAEVDGNFVCTGAFPLVDMHWQGKFRGPGFEPVPFELLSVKADRVRDSKGAHIATVIARPLSEHERSAMSSAVIRDQDELLKVMLENAELSIADLARKLGWFTGAAKDQPYKSKVSRELKTLEKAKHTMNIRGSWSLTELGKREAERIQRNHHLAGGY